MQLSCYDLDIVWCTSLNMIATLQPTIQLRKADCQWLFKMASTHSSSIYYRFPTPFPMSLHQVYEKNILATQYYIWLCSEIERSVNRNALYNITLLIPKEISSQHTTSLNSMLGFHIDKLLIFLGYWLLIRFILLLILQSLSFHGPILEKRFSFLSTWIDMLWMRKKILAVNKGRDRLTKRHRQGCQFLTTRCLAVCRSPCQEFCA